MRTLPRVCAWQLAGVAMLALGGCAAPQPQQLPELYQASLDGRQEVPAVATGGSGQARVEVDASGLMRWSVDYEGLSGPVTAAHVHGPAGPGQNAGVLIPLAVPAGGTSFSGQARITPEQLTQLASGQWYVNLHTARHPAGEIRGQLRPRR
jgi:hypothetical protein